MADYSSFYLLSTHRINQTMPQKQTRQWWKEANAYQIWPASFQDSNDDGFGDLPGIVSRLDYLKNLGIDLIWLSPVYDSPQHDMGYDISDYENIWPKYGSLEDMDILIKEAKARGIKLMMDLVVNHTSNEHKWFIESAKSADESNPFRDWYLWREPKGFDAGGKPIPPNNWRSAFGGSAWEYVEARKQFYLHIFLPEQPDLNWFNPVTRQAIYTSAIEFWLKRGIEGFRIDVVNLYCKDTNFPDAAMVLPGETYQPVERQHVLNGPLMHDWLQEQRREALDKYGDVVLVGELHGTAEEEIMRYLSPDTRELDMIFDFDLFHKGDASTGLPHDERVPKLTELKPAFVKTQGLMSQGKAWPTTFLENHDHSRSIDRFGPGARSPYREDAAKMLAILVCTLSGTLYVYQGQEMGMTNMPKTWKREDFRDKLVLRYFAEMAERYAGDEDMLKVVLDSALRIGRDNARTPVQWSDGANGGFTKGAPWIGVNDNYEVINAAAQEGKSDSVLEFWRRILKLRKEYKDVLVYGDFELLDRSNEQKLSFIKSCSDTGNQMLVELSFSDQEQALLDISQVKGIARALAISSCPRTEALDAESPLKPWEGRVWNLASWKA